MVTKATTLNPASRSNDTPTLTTLDGLSNWPTPAHTINHTSFSTSSDKPPLLLNPAPNRPLLLPKIPKTAQERKPLLGVAPVAVVTATETMATTIVSSSPRSGAVRQLFTEPNTFQHVSSSLPPSSPSPLSSSNKINSSSLNTSPKGTNSDGGGVSVGVVNRVSSQQSRSGGSHVLMKSNSVDNSSNNNGSSNSNTGKGDMCMYMCTFVCVREYRGREGIIMRLRDDQLIK